MNSRQSVLVSVIVPCYNYARYLPDTLNSVLAQEYKNWECIVVDDGSTDHTAEVANHYTRLDRRFTCIRQQNRGLPAARNAGIKKSRGGYLQFVDSDDRIHPSKLRLQLQQMELDRRIDIVYGDGLFFKTESPEVFFTSRTFKKNSSRKIDGDGRVVLSRLVKNNIMEISCALLKKEVINKAGLFDEQYRAYEDWEFWMRCAVSGCYFFYSPLAGTETFIRLGHQSMMSNKKILVESGIKFREQLGHRIAGRDSIYNQYRLGKLYLRNLLKIY